MRGAGRAECNGFYQLDGKWRGYSRWKHVHNNVWLRRGGDKWEHRWYLVNCRERANPNPNFYKADSHGGAIPPEHGWADDGGGGGVPHLVFAPDLMHPLASFPIHSFNYAITRSSTNSLTSPTHSCTHSLTHALIHPPKHPPKHGWRCFADNRISIAQYITKIVIHLRCLVSTVVTWRRLACLRCAPRL